MSVPRKSLAYNSLFSLIDKAYTAISNLLLIPFIVHRLGMDVYGAWVILVTVSSYFGLGNCGISFSFEKYIAQYNAISDKRSLRQFIATAFYGSLALGLAVFLISLVFAPTVFNLLLKTDSFQHYKYLFVLLMGSISLSLVSNIFTAIPRGMQRYDFFSLISISGRTVYNVLVIVFCIKGRGILSMIIGQYGLIIVTLLLSIVVTRKFFKYLNLSPGYFSWQTFKSMFDFGMKIQASMLSVIITQSFDKLIIAHFAGLRFVAVYDIGSRLVAFLKDLPTFLYVSITPRSSELYAIDKGENVRTLYLTGTKYLSIICLGLASMLIPVSREILSVWMRVPIDPLSIYVMQVLLFSMLFNSTTGLGTSIGIGIGRPGDIARSNIVMAVVNIICSSALFFVFGAKGIVWGTAAGLIISTFIYYLLLNSSLGVNNKRFGIEAFFMPCAVNAVITIILMIGMNALSVSNIIPFGNIGSKIIIITLNISLVLIASFIAYVALKFITVDELRKNMPFLFKRK
jgi:O-antigen/teichoic acid export membrane protein